MKLNPILAGAAAACCGLFMSAHAQVFTLDPPASLNDYISIGEFNTPGNVEGWMRNSSAVAPLSVANGELEVTTTAADPWFYRMNFAASLGIPSDFNLVQVRLKITSGSRVNWEMFWGSTTHPGPVGGQQIGYNLGFDDSNYHVVEFDLSSQLSDGGSLDDFRIDPGQEGGNKFVVDYIRVGKVSPDTDGDGLSDTVETGTGVFKSARDTGTDPTKPDTDGDGTNDGIEVQYGTDPNNASSFPVPTIDRYSQNPAVYIAGVTIDANVPTTGNGTVTGFTVTPALPAGLTLDPATGTVSGTPTAASAAADYTVTATFVGGKTDTETLNITVRTPYFDYTLPKYTFQANASVSIAPNFYGQAPISFSVSPDLPAGLSLDPGTGTISGSGTSYTPPGAYAVVATYASLPNYTNVVTLSVVEAPVISVDPSQELLDYFSLGEFQDSSDTTGWFSHSIQLPFQVVDGALVVVTTGDDPYFGTDPALPADYRLLEFRVKVVSGSAVPSNIYWSEDAPNRGYSEATHFEFYDIVEDGQYHVYRIDFGKSLDGIINGIRIDPSGSAGLTAHFDYIRVGNLIPRLKVERRDNSLRIMWPSAATGFTLQSASSVAGTWSAAGEPTVVEDNTNVVTVPMTAGPKFYRLIQ